MVRRAPEGAGDGLLVSRDVGLRGLVVVGQTKYVAELVDDGVVDLCVARVVADPAKISSRLARSRVEGLRADVGPASLPLKRDANLGERVVTEFELDVGVRGPDRRQPLDKAPALVYRRGSARIGG